MVRRTSRPSAPIWVLIVSGLPAVRRPRNAWGVELQTRFASEVGLPI